MSPELLALDHINLRGVRPTKKSDCYALGMVMYEVLSGNIPFPEVHAFPLVMIMIIRGERPGRPQGIEGLLFTDDLWDMVQLCWSQQPNDRPTVEVVLERLIPASVNWQPPPPNVSDDLAIF